MQKSNYEYLYNYDAVTDSLLEHGDKGYVDFNDYEHEVNKRVPLIIWSNDLETAEIINIPMGMIDVLPTLGNMLNVYNKYSLGNDVMGIKDGENIVVFNDGSYITSKIYYSAKNNEAYTLSNGVITESYISKNQEYANKILDISNNIIMYDLLKDLK